MLPTQHEAPAKAAPEPAGAQLAPATNTSSTSPHDKGPSMQTHSTCHTRNSCSEPPNTETEPSDAYKPPLQGSTMSQPHNPGHTSQPSPAWEPPDTAGQTENARTQQQQPWTLTGGGPPTDELETTADESGSSRTPSRRHTPPELLGLYAEPQVGLHCGAHALNSLLLEQPCRDRLHNQLPKEHKHPTKRVGHQPRRNTLRCHSWQLPAQ
jgi:hypothetical protein